MPARVIRHQQEAGPVRVPLFSRIVADAVCYAWAAVIFSRAWGRLGNRLSMCAGFMERRFPNRRTVEGVTSSQMLH